MIALEKGIEYTTAQVERQTRPTYPPPPPVCIQTPLLGREILLSPFYGWTSETERLSDLHRVP